MELVSYCIMNARVREIYSKEESTWHEYIACDLSVHVHVCVLLTRDSIPGSAATMVDRAFIALVLTCTAGSLSTRSNYKRAMALGHH